MVLDPRRSHGTGAHRSSRRRDEGGQASLEYAGALAVVAAVLVLTASVANGGAIFNGVLRGMERALCRVTGDDCLATELSACTVRSRETGAKVGLKVTFVKLGGSLSVLREELSDGTVDVTLVDGGDAAPTAAVGASGGVRLGKGRLGGGAIAQAEMLVRLGQRRVWHRPDAASADRLVSTIRKHVAANLGERVVPLIGPVVRGAARLAGYDGDRLPPPDVSGLSAGLEGAAKAELVGAGSVKAGLKSSLGGTIDHATGRRTLVLSLEGDAMTALSGGAGDARLEGSGGPSVELTFDRQGAPLELAVKVAGTARGGGGLDLPGQRVKVASGGRMEVSSRLDLRRPSNREVYERLVAALAPTGARDLPGAVAALAQQIRTSSRRDVTRSATGSTGYGADAEAALGARVGGSVELSRTTTELRDAWTRPAGGAWERRTDCLPARERA